MDISYPTMVPRRAHLPCLVQPAGVTNIRTARHVIPAIPIATYGVKRLLPEKEIRLEVLFLSNALLAILGVVATVNGRTAVAGISEVDLAALAGVCGLVVLGLIGGFIQHGIRLKRMN